MKQFYFFTLLLLFSLSTYSQQGYDFGLQHNSGSNFTVVARPNFNSTGNTDVSNIGFTLMLPTGNYDIVNGTSELPGRIWSIQQYDGTTLNNAGVGDGTRDAFLITIPPGQSLLTHSANDIIPLVSFDLNNIPTNGLMEILPNNDPINIGLGNVFSSFYQANIDNTTTQDYFLGYITDQDTIILSTLSLTDIKNDSFELEIYPNPTSDIVYIKSNLKAQSYTIYDLLGKLISSDLIKNNRVNTRHLSSGEYLLVLNFGNNISSTEKIIKQ
jgi:hypothetical protein